MNTTILPRTMLILALATLIAFGSAPRAEAAPATGVLAKWSLPKGDRKFDWKEAVPTVKFKASGKLSKTTAKVNMYALITVAGRSHKVSIFSMGIAKKGKSVKVQRQVGKLKVSLTVSWSGERSITIKGKATYMKIKVPVPPIRLRV